MTGENQILALSEDVGAKESRASEEQHAEGERFDGTTDPPTPAREEVRVDAASLCEMRERHTLHLGQLIDRGHALALDMFEDASNREVEHLRRIEFVRLADRVAETTRKLIVAYDRHTEEKG